MRQLANVYVRDVRQNGSVVVVWSKDDIEPKTITGPFASVSKDHVEGTFSVGDRAQALVETDDSQVVRLIHSPKGRA